MKVRPRDLAEAGFTPVDVAGVAYQSFRFGGGYELAIEPLAFGGIALALYHDDDLLLRRKVEIEPVAEPAADPRHGGPVGLNEVAGLAVAFKALVHRAGGRVEIFEWELLQARELHARIDADTERMVVELVDGPPPDVPRFDAFYEPPDPRDADETYHGLGDVDGGDE